MLPGAPGYVDLVQLSLAHTREHHKEDLFQRHVVNLGHALPLPVKAAYLETMEQHHHFIEIRSCAEYILQKHPAKLLAGFSTLQKEEFHAAMVQFWAAYRLHNPGHDVFVRFADSLHLCLPLKIHSDEGTGPRRAPVNQISWGPVLSSSPNSFDRYFFWSSMNGEDYKFANAGYEAGNAVLDEVSTHLAAQATDVYINGMDCIDVGTLHLVWVAVEGDLPAQARALHLKRNFNCMPNQLCPWCLADDREVPFSDYRENAAWRATSGTQRPWTTESPFHGIPGWDSELILAKDLFHLCHLGAVRGFAINLLCYMCWTGMCWTGVWDPCHMNQIFS